MTRPTWDTKLRQALIAAQKKRPQADLDRVTREVGLALKPPIQEAINGIRNTELLLFADLIEIFTVDEADRPRKVARLKDKINKLPKEIVIS